MRVWTDAAASARGVAYPSGSGAIKHMGTTYYRPQQKDKNKDLRIEKIRGGINPADLVTGRTVGWTVGSTAGRSDGRVCLRGVRSGAWTTESRSSDGWTNGRTDGWKDGPQTHERPLDCWSGRTESRTADVHGRALGRTEGRTVGGRDNRVGRADGRKVGQTCVWKDGGIHLPVTADSRRSDGRTRRRSVGRVGGRRGGRTAQRKSGSMVGRKKRVTRVLVGQTERRSLGWSDQRTDSATVGRSCRRVSRLYWQRD